jgi:hypothetical protein
VIFVKMLVKTLLPCKNVGYIEIFQAVGKYTNKTYAQITLRHIVINLS